MPNVRAQRAAKPSAGAKGWATAGLQQCSLDAVLLTAVNADEPATADDIDDYATPA